VPWRPGVAARAAARCVRDGFGWRGRRGARQAATHGHGAAVARTGARARAAPAWGLHRRAASRASARPALGHGSGRLVAAPGSGPASQGRPARPAAGAASGQAVRPHGSAHDLRRRRCGEPAARGCLGQEHRARDPEFAEAHSASASPASAAVDRGARGVRRGSLPPRAQGAAEVGVPAAPRAPAAMSAHSLAPAYAAEPALAAGAAAPPTAARRWAPCACCRRSRCALHGRRPDGGWRCGRRGAGATGAFRCGAGAWRARAGRRGRRAAARQLRLPGRAQALSPISSAATIPGAQQVRRSGSRRASRPRRAGRGDGDGRGAGACGALGARRRGQRRRGAPAAAAAGGRGRAGAGAHADAAGRRRPARRACRRRVPGAAAGGRRPGARLPGACLPAGDHAWPGAPLCAGLQLRV